MDEKGRNEEIILHFNAKQVADILILAVEKNNIGLVETLISQGVSVKGKNDIAICKAAERGFVEIFKMLLDAGADVKTRHNYPLEAAATSGHDEIIDLIAAYDPDALQTNNYAINYAINCGHISTVEKLLTLGVKLTHDVDDIIYQAEYEGYDDIAEMLEKASE